MTAPTDDLHAALADVIDRMRLTSPAHASVVADVLLPVVESYGRACESQGYERGRRDFQFQPSGDNHHNAALCPYCSPDRESYGRACAATALHAAAENFYGRRMHNPADWLRARADAAEAAL